MKRCVLSWPLCFGMDLGARGGRETHKGEQAREGEREETVTSRQRALQSVQGRAGHAQTRAYRPLLGKEPCRPHG